MSEAEESRKRFGQTADHRSRYIGSKGLIGIGFVAEGAGEDHAREEHWTKRQQARHDITPNYSRAKECFTAETGAPARGGLGTAANRSSG